MTVQPLIDDQRRETPAREEGLRLEGVTKRYGDQPVLEGLDLEVAAGSFTVLVGPSGCGKSTLLRVIAGLEGLDAGRVRIGGRDVTAVAPRERGLSMVFQDFALYPHMTVEENITFGLRLAARRRGSGLDRVTIAARAAEVSAMLGLDGLGERRPHQLSGGQRQRVALARAVIRRPVAFLMDEPLSNLDAALRTRTRTELVRLHRDLAATVVYVTHDQVEALSMATHLVVLDHGVIAQQGTPTAIHDRPATLFVATFIGSPAMNTVPAGIRGDAVHGPGLAGAVPGTAGSGAVVVGWRPGAGRAVPAGAATPSSGLRVAGRVDVVENLGDTVQVTLLPVTGGDPSGAWTATLPRDQRPEPGAELVVRVEASDVHLFDPGSGARY